MTNENWSFKQNIINEAQSEIKQLKINRQTCNCAKGYCFVLQCQTDKRNT